MKLLIVATTRLPANAEEEIKLGKRTRIDYLELARHLKADYLDYGSPELSQHPSLNRLEEKFRLDLYRARYVARKVRQEHYDVVLSMSERIGLPLSHLLDRRIKHIVLLHNPLSPHKLRLAKLLGSLKRCDTVVTFSQAEGRAASQALGLSKAQIKVLPLAIDTDYYKPPLCASAKHYPEVALSSGVAQRDYPTLIEALRKLPQVSCNISSASAWDNLKEVINSTTLPPNVKLTPYSHYELLEAYSCSRFIITPINVDTSHWSAGLSTILQAGAMGKAIVATRMPAYSDYIMEGETGLLVEGGQSGAMAEAIDYLWKNPEKAEAMGRRAKQWVRDNFCLEVWLKNVSSLIDQHEASKHFIVS